MSGMYFDLGYSTDDATPTTYYRCHNDDSLFLQRLDSQGTRCRRAGLLWGIVGRLCPWSKREETFLGLLRTEPFVWLWVDGDEQRLDRDYLGWSDEFRGRVKDALGNRLGASFPSNHDLTREQQTTAQAILDAPPALRIACIAWLTITSTTIKRVQAEWYSDREVWGLYELIDRWWMLLLGGVREEILRCIEYGETLSSKFQSQMAAQGHTCHLTVFKEERMQCWLYMHSVLFGYQPLQVMRFREDEGCLGCNRNALAHVSTDSIDPPASYITVVMSFIHIHTYSSFSTPFFEWVSSGHFKQIPASAHQSAARIIDDTFARAPRPPPNPQCLSWVNHYPAAWRNYLPKGTWTEWKQADDTIQSYLSSASGSTTEVDLLAWVGSLIWAMGESDMSENERTQKFLWCAEGCLGDEPLRRVLETPRTREVVRAIDKFNTALTRSPHTCWTGFSKGAIGCYAALMLLLKGTEEIAVFGIDIDIYEEWCCTMCRLDEEVERRLKVTAEHSEKVAITSTILTSMQKAWPSQEAWREAVKDLYERYYKNPLNDPAEDRPIGHLEQTASGEECLPSSGVESVDRIIRQAGNNEIDSGSESEEIESGNAHGQAQRKESAVRAASFSVPKSRMQREIKDYLITSLEAQDVLLDHDRGKPKLPWTTLEYTLDRSGVEMVNWPKEVPRPGDGETDSNKGIGGLSTKYLRKLYEAIHNPEKRLTFRKTEQASRNGQENRELTSNEAPLSSAKKRRVEEQGTEQAGKRSKMRFIQVHY